jgi:hypothetical protein
MTYISLVCKFKICLSFCSLASKYFSPHIFFLSFSFYIKLCNVLFSVSPLAGRNHVGIYRLFAGKATYLKIIYKRKKLQWLRHRVQVIFYTELFWNMTMFHKQIMLIQLFYLTTADEDRLALANQNHVCANR